MATEDPNVMAEVAAPIVRTAQRVVYSNRFIAVHDDDVRLPDGSAGHHLRIIESGGQPGVAILPIAQDRIGLVRTYRYPLAQWEWAIPRGFAHSADPMVSARNELREELGQAPSELLPIGAMTPNSGILDSKVHLFIATYGNPPHQPLDTEEVYDVRWVRPAELFGDIRSGEITDGFTLAAITQAAVRGLLMPDS